MSSKPTDRLKALFSQHPDLDKDVCSELVSLYDRKLWHELSLRLREVFKDPVYMPYIQPIFNDFVVDFGQKMNLIYFAQFAHDVAKTMDRDAAVELLRKHSASIKELKRHPTQEPLLFMEMSIAEHFIDVSHMDECKELLDKGLKQLEGMSEVRERTSPVI
jgi:26S proteasome regulatory subunit N9